jgi:GNAT superfamily N-acetyltransferase
MLTPNEPVFEKHLANGLTLRTASTPAEVDRVAALSGVIHDPSVCEMTRKLFYTHPNTTGRDLMYIENDATHEVVATVCLIPRTVVFDGIDLPTAELGIVGTRESYRKQGLNRILMELFWQRFQERGALLSIIQGIPYFYRQYGYEFAMLALEGGWRIQPDQIPAPFEPGYTIRPATPADIPVLCELYDTQARRQNVRERRDPEVWEYLLTRTEQPEEMQHDTLMVLDPNGKPAAYFRVPDFHFDPNLLIIDEVSDVSFAAALAIFDHLKALTTARNRDGIRLTIPQNSQFLNLARTLGARNAGTYSFQVSIPDRMAFLRRVAPLFEARLADSMFAGLTGTYSLNLYREVIGLTFAGGKLMGVGPACDDEHTILSVPPTQFIPLALGGSTLGEIHVLFPDASVRHPWGLLVETLFPKSSSYIATEY